MATPVREKDALRSFAFIENFRTMAQDLKATCDSVDTTIGKILNTFSEKQIAGKIFYYTTKGILTEEDSAAFASYDTDCINKEGDAIHGFFIKEKRGWKGVEFKTQDALLEFINVGYDTFDCGDIKFRPFKNASVFFEQLSEMAIPETWHYKAHKSSFQHPVLKSFIENTYCRLVHEQRTGAEKIILNDTHLLFNTGLLSKYFHVIYIVAERSKQSDSFECQNPILTTGLEKLKNFGGGFKLDGKSINKEAMMPKKAEFFSAFNEVIFNIDFDVDKTYEKFNHIIEHNRKRFPDKYQNSPSHELAQKVDHAIDAAKLMAERNYKFIVPQYRPTENKIQFLMPLYLDAKFDKAPDLALVLDLNEDIYVPETVLPLDAAYQNARLIAKPDNQWLDPNEIQLLDE